MLEVRNYIRGEWLTPKEGKHIEVRNPADLDEVLGKGNLATAKHADAAIAAAVSAFSAWSGTPAPKRGEIGRASCRERVYLCV